MTISTLQQSTEVTEVGLVTISEVVEDKPNNVWVREVKVFGELAGNARPLLFTLRLSSATEAGVQLNAPAQIF